VPVAKALEDRAVINMKQSSKTIVILFQIALCLFSGSCLTASAQDTVKASTQQRQVLGTVTIAGDRRPSQTLSQAPVQVVDIQKLEKSGALLLSDAVKQMAGVTLRDYGGIGGMKTVSSRGLGSQFSTLTIDGIAVNDCQNGQVDLGRYMIGNSAYISLSNGQEENSLTSARAAAAGNVVNMQTSRPTFMPGQRNHFGVGFEGGSFGMLSPALSWQHKLNDRLSLTAWGNLLKSNGDYPFTLYYTNDHNGLSSRERREHSAMWMATGDMNLYYTPCAGRDIVSKVHYVQGYHELPGPVVFYASKGSEDTREKLFFAQTRYRASLRQWSYQLIGKYQYSYDQYEDFRAMTASRYLTNEYSQNEGYLSGAAEWRPYQWVTLSAATDAALASLHSSLAKNSHVMRRTSLTTVAVAHRSKRLSVKASLLATLVGEDACDAPGIVHYRRLSPYVGLSFKPLNSNPLRLRYFFKDSYRIPNFNEMYYFTMPLDTLRPERASQHNIGVTIPLHEAYNADSTLRTLYSITVDAYHNRVSDKIIAVPRQNMFIWSTMNLGQVQINGLDISCNAEAHLRDMGITLTINYSHQDAIDITDPDDSKTYHHQIPYTPKNSGGVTLYFLNKIVNIGYNCMVIGERYYQQENSADTRLEPYSEHGISADRSFELPIGDLRVQARILNLFDKQYEVVRSYPMMGRNFRIKVSYTF